MNLFLRALFPLALLPLGQAQNEAPTLPDAPGKDVTERICGACHEAGVVTKYRNSKDDWQPIVDDMRGRGADGSEADFKTIVNYLGHYFGPEVNVNKATAADLQSQLEITAAEAVAIVNYREAQGNFKDLSGLRKVPGLDMKKIEPIQQRLVFN
jgi:competence protein ComEA